MSVALGLSGIKPQINSKASAVTYAIQLCTSFSVKSNTCSVDVKKAQRIFNFITQNVELPDVAKDTYAEIAEDFKPYLESILKGLEAKLQSSQL
jgi:hypothetical protein